MDTALIVVLAACSLTFAGVILGTPIFWIVWYIRRERRLRRLMRERSGVTRASFVDHYVTQGLPSAPVAATWDELSVYTILKEFPVLPEDRIDDVAPIGDAYDWDDFIDDIIRRSGRVVPSSAEWDSLYVDDGRFDATVDGLVRGMAYVYDRLQARTPEA